MKTFSDKKAIFKNPGILNICFAIQIQLKKIAKGKVSNVFS